MANFCGSCLFLVLLGAVTVSTLDSFWKIESPQVFDFYSAEKIGLFPSHRYSHAAIHDEETDRMIVTHGYFYDHMNHRPTWLSDTWAFFPNSSTWSRLHEGREGPEPRYGLSAVKHQRRMLVFGGDGPSSRLSLDNSIHFNDLWAFDLDTHHWSCVQCDDFSGPRPSPRSLHVSALITIDQKTVMVVHGGLHKGDTWLFDLASEQWTEVQPSTPASSPGVRHGAVAVGHGDAVYLHGGSTVSPVRIFEDLWVFRPSQGWTALPASSPQPSGRSYHAAALLAGPRPQMVLFGGANCTGSCVCKNDVWLLDLLHSGSPAWQKVGVSNDIDPRYHQSLTVSKGVARTFGGESYSPRYMYHNSVAAIALSGDAMTPAALLGLLGLGVAVLLGLARCVKAGKKHVA